MNRIRLRIFVHVQRALSLLPRRDRRILFMLIAFQASLSLADLIAVAALGLVSVSAAALATGQPAAIPSPFNTIAAEISRPEMIVAVAIAAASLMIIKSIVSFWGTRRAFRFLANRQAMIAAKLANELLSRPLLQVMRRSTQENAYALTAGVFAVTVGILGTFVVIVTELSLAIVLLTGLLVVDPQLTFFTVIFFGTVAALLHLMLSGWAIRIGTKQAQAAALGHAAIQEAISGYREVVVAGRRGVYTSRFQTLMWDVARVQSDRMMISSIGKYIFELALILGAGLLIMSQAATGNLISGAATVVVFFAAASRIMPALMRMQGAALDMKIAVGGSQISWSLIDDLNNSDAEPALTAEKLAKMYRLSAEGYPMFTGSVSIDSVSLTYPGSSEPALANVCLEVPTGSSLALVGTSGAGKSSLADIILGVVHPDSGVVRISELSPSECVRSWPGALAYVPQDVGIVNGTVRANVAMGLPEELVEDERVWEALERARLRDFLLNSREGLDTLVGENGVKLSGGQRQRLGIARALYTRPRLLVLDEATSALDAQTEADISETILNMSGSVTRIIIAHRLATIRECDVVAYLDKGRLVASGNFDEVRQAIPDFDRQAELLGL